MATNLQCNSELKHSTLICHPTQHTCAWH